MYSKYLLQIRKRFNMFTALLWKNFILRKRHWILTILEISTPISLILLITFMRSRAPDLSKVYVNSTTALEKIPLENIEGNFNIRDFQLFHSPTTEFTDLIIREVQQKLELYNEGMLNSNFYYVYYMIISHKNYTNNGVTTP